MRELRLLNIDFLEAAVGTTRLCTILEPLPLGAPWDHLIVLDLSVNKVQVLGSVLGEMVGLQTLLLTANALQVMPDVTTRLTKLRMLRLDENRLSEFPMPVCLSDPGTRSTKEILIEADVSGLGIPQSESVTVWHPGEPNPSIDYIDMSNNAIHSIAKPLVFVTTLTTLKLAKNRLVKLPPNFDQLVMLTELDFSQNEFTVFVNEIWKLTNLKSLNVSLNKLLELPPSIKDLKALTAFDMSDNKVKELPLSIGQLRNLEKPVFKGNPLEVGLLFDPGNDAAVQIHDRI
jgi:Leucine-rich repeat (LRR) protein